MSHRQPIVEQQWILKLAQHLADGKKIGGPSELYAAIGIDESNNTLCQQVRTYLESEGIYNRKTISYTAFGKSATQHEDTGFDIDRPRCLQSAKLIREELARPIDYLALWTRRARQNRVFAAVIFLVIGIGSIGGVISIIKQAIDIVHSSQTQPPTNPPSTSNSIHSHSPASE